MNTEGSNKRPTNQSEAYAIMARNGFSSGKRREWMIWAARHRGCKECKAEPNYPCSHLGDLRKIHQGQLAEGFARYNKNPHESRIDWARLIQGLYKRGYR